jgi:hypothetical protein
MSRRNHKDAKAKRDRGGFVAVPFTVLHSPAYARLSPYAVKLLLDIGSQYKGHNNGDLCAAWKIMHPKGWRSEETLAKAKKELLRAGFIAQMRKGHRPNVCSLYALTWCALDPNEKHDVGAGAFEFAAWRANDPVPPIKPRSPATDKINSVTTTPVVAGAV